MLAEPPMAQSITPESPPATRTMNHTISASSDGNTSDTSSVGYFSGSEILSASTGNLRSMKHIPSSQKFPHMRAQLASMAREYKLKTLDPTLTQSSSESDADAEDSRQESWNDSERVSSTLVRQVAALLDEEDEDGLKQLLKSQFEIDDDATEGPVLDLMHAHKDDISGVPFLFLTPTRRPLSRPSSRASSHSFRLAPGTPARSETPVSTVSAPSSPSLLGPIRRPHTSMASPLAGGHASYMNSSPSSSPTLAHSIIQSSSFLATSLPASPLSSPRLLSAKASEFRPTPRPLSAASSNPPSLTGRRAETPSPDLWAHGSGALRGTSKLAIASPLIPDSTLYPGTPPRALTPTSPLRMSSSAPGNDDDEEDPFDPFVQASKTAPLSFHHSAATANPADFETGLSNSSNSTSSMSDEGVLWGASAYGHESYGEYDSTSDPNALGIAPGYAIDAQLTSPEDFDPETAAALTDGMTPFDVLASVFGSTLAPSELEEALAVNGYEFERAMQWLIDRARPTAAPTAQPRQPYTYGAGVQVVPRGQMSIRGGRSGFGAAPSMRGVGGNGQRFSNGRPTPGGNRVCRYFLAGECMRADCRFSHDLDRALCRFWLRGTCAKGESCEFLHHLPNEVDVQGLNSVMTHIDLNDQNNGQVSNGPPVEEFPTLSHESARVSRRGGFTGYRIPYHDASRTRFASAVKKAPFNGAPPAGVAAQMAGRREAKAAVGDSVYSRPTVVAPRPSPRIKLRAPSLLPTLPTGDSISVLYMAYRQRALQLGAARNACLSRAADAWRRGDGAAAKRFSREGHELNAKMSAETADAAGKLVRERARVAEQAVRARDLSWSDDPADRTSRGRSCGGGLGIVLGVSSKDSSGDEMSKLTQEERTEVLLDLHGLHSNEATEVLEEFLLSLEREHFFGVAYIVVGEEKHTGTQDPARGSSRARLGTAIREWLHNWGYPWNERDGIVAVDPLTHMQ